MISKRFFFSSQARIWARKTQPSSGKKMMSMMIRGELEQSDERELSKSNNYFEFTVITFFPSCLPQCPFFYAFKLVQQPKNRHIKRWTNRFFPILLLSENFPINDNHELFHPAGAFEEINFCYPIKVSKLKVPLKPLWKSPTLAQHDDALDVAGLLALASQLLCLTFPRWNGTEHKCRLN